nr:unnamed protein product [Callosobruchus analis]
MATVDFELADHSSSVERTTNACESFHQKFNGSFYQSHPNNIYGWMQNEMRQHCLVCYLAIR